MLEVVSVLFESSRLTRVLWDISLRTAHPIYLHPSKLEFGPETESRR